MKKSGLESPTPIPQTQSAFHQHNNQTPSFVAGCASAIQIIRPLEPIAGTDSITPTAPRLAPFELNQDIACAMKARIPATQRFYRRPESADSVRPRSP